MIQAVLLLSSSSLLQSPNNPFYPNHPNNPIYSNNPNTPKNPFYPNNPNDPIYPNNPHNPNNPGKKLKGYAVKGGACKAIKSAKYEVVVVIALVIVL